jgi:hypothetical protein
MNTSFVRFQSYDELILSKINEKQTKLDADPDDAQLREDLAMWNEIFESRKALLIHFVLLYK